MSCVAEWKLNHARRGKYARRKRKRVTDKLVPKDPAKEKIRSSLSRRNIGLAHVKTDFGLGMLGWAKGAFIGKREVVVESVASLQELKDEGFEIYEWDGRWVAFPVCAPPPC